MALLTLAVIAYFKFQPEVQNAVMGHGRFGIEAMSEDDERFVAKRLSTFIKYSYSHGRLGVG